MTKKLIKSKILTILLVLVMLVGSLPISVGDDSTEALSIYNSTAGLTNIPIIDDIDDESTDTVSIYNSTNGSANIPITDDIDDEPIAAVSIYNSTNGSASRPIIDAEENFFELTEFKKVPIDNAYSKDKLQNINVSDGTLEAFSRFGQWLDTQNVNAAAEDINIMYIDDDLRVIENYWIFATRPESKERYIEIIRESKSRNPSPDEMIDFLDRFDERYPVKYVRTGLALFITVENKDALLSEISKEDIRMLEAIRSALLEETRMELNWGSSNPNIHADMSRWAAERAGFDPYYVNIISNHAAKPDEVSYIDVMLSNIVEFTPSGILINGILISTVEFLYLKNYNHYYNPTALNGNGVGGAPANIEKELNSILTATSKEEKVKHLSYASHYMADLSMPLHTNHAVNQSRWFGLGLLFGQPHFAYENDYVGKNWTTGQTGHNFSHFAKNVNGGYIIHDPVAQSKDLANYAYLYSDEAWAAGNLLAVFGNLYTPPPSLFYATIFSIDEGQRHMIGLMEYGYQLIESPASGFTNQQDITLQLEKPGYRVQKVDLTNLRVSMGAGDSAYIHLNGREILRFVDSSSGGTLRVFNENGNQLGIIAPVNGKTTFENRTFDVSFIHDGSRMIIEIQRYHRGVPDGTFSYSYMTNNDMSTLRAYMIGYQSNVDYISSQYNIHYQPLSGAPLGGSFENQQDITLQLGKAGHRVQKVDLTNLRVSMGAGDSAYIHLNGREILRFVDSSSGGTLRIYNENGNQLGSIAPINGKPTFENRTFDVSFIHDGSRTNIEIQRYHRGVPDGTFSYSYLTNNDMSTLRAYMIGYQSNVDYISSQYSIYHQPLSGVPLLGSFENQQDITLPLGKAGHRVQKVDLTDLRVSMGAGDSAYIHLNGREILRFVDSSSGGTLRIYNENGNQLGSIAPINGKPTFENRTFDVSFIHDGSRMNVEIQRYHRGVPDGTFSYSYLTSNDMSTLRAYMIGYQSNVDYISSQYGVYYEP